MTCFDFPLRPLGKAATLHFSLLSQAYFVDAHWGYGCPVRGVEKMGQIAHKHGIPLTYFVTARSACQMADILAEYHEEFGDEVQQQIRFRPAGVRGMDEREAIESASIAELVDHIKRERNQIIKALPWSEPTLFVAGTGVRTENLILALEQLGYQGLHGHCPFQIAVDGLLSFATGWSSFYISADNYQCPADPDVSGKSLVGLEWTARDLCKSWHYALPEVYSTDPNDVERADICTDTHIEYWKDLTRQWLRNIRLNGDLFFQMHQESHEMDPGQGLSPYTTEMVEYTGRMMDEYFSWLRSLPECLPNGHPDSGDRVVFETASEHIGNYKKRCPYTPPTIMAFKEISIAKDAGFWENVAKGQPYHNKDCRYLTKSSFVPSKSFQEHIQKAVDIFHYDGATWTDSLCYYDADCMLLFDDAQETAAPIWAANYQKARTRPNNVTEGLDASPANNDDIENIRWFQEVLPEPTIAWDESGSNGTITVETDRALPWGAAWWDTENFKARTLATVIKSTIPAKAWLIEGKIMFVRANLTAGVHTFIVSLG